MSVFDDQLAEAADKLVAAVDATIAARHAGNLEHFFEAARELEGVRLDHRRAVERAEHLTRGRGPGDAPDNAAAPPVAGPS